jgi:hypothetical protein
VRQEWAARGPGEAVPDPYPPEAALHALAIWSRLGGVISLEIAGALDRMGVDATSFFEAELAQLLPDDGHVGADPVSPIRSE